MDIELITTFKEYNESYQVRLEKHKAKYEDYDELHFIESELCFYENCYATAHVTKHEIYRTNEDIDWYDYIYYNDIENDNRTEQVENELVCKIIVDLGRPKTNCYDLEACQRLTISFTKIIEFLQELQHYKTIADIKQSSILSEFIKKEQVNTTETRDDNNNSQNITNKLSWSGDQTAFIELVKALIVNGNIKVNKGEQGKTIKTLSDFFNFKVNNPNKLISDLKKRNNGSETLFLNELKSSLLDYITIEKKKNTRY